MPAKNPWSCTKLCALCNLFCATGFDVLSLFFPSIEIQSCLTNINIFNNSLLCKLCPMMQIDDKQGIDSASISTFNFEVTYLCIKIIQMGSC